MDEATSCPNCHASVRTTDYFCYNCGKKLHPTPLSTSITTEILYYLGSIALPPLGIYWGIKYLRQVGSAAKRIGLISILLTVVSLVVATIWTTNLVNGISSQVNSQLNGIPGL